MANHKSALKRAKQNKVRRARNRNVKTRVKGVVKEVRAVAAKQQEGDPAEILNQAKSVIQKAAKNGVIHPRTASRKISRLARLVNAVSA